MTLPGVLRGWLAGTVAGGLWLGLGGRAAMVVIALAAGHPLRWSWGGSVEIVLFGMILAGVATAAWQLLRHLLPALRRGRGLLFGAILFGIFAAVPPPSAQSAVAGIGQRTLSLALFGGLLVGFGVLVETILVRRARAHGGAR